MGKGPVSARLESCLGYTQLSRLLFPERRARPGWYQCNKLIRQIVLKVASDIRQIVLKVASDIRASLTESS